ncbi:MAG: hypothetical protein HY074_11860, partial [Deltaproteobacteria bacterium]|nr:hypothetical protein [Deltaproteobacteria bacterium]
MAHSGTDRLEIPRISGPERLVLLAGYPTVLLLGGLLLFYSQVAFGWWTVAGKLALALSAVCALALAAGGAVLVLLVTAVY